MKALIPQEVIEKKIFLIRGHKVMLDRDLARLYGVTTKALNQAVKRNKRRFPDDFVFRLNKVERKELVTICDRFKTLKHSVVNPHVFTEQGVAMLSSVLNSEKAVLVKVIIMRTFVRLRQILSTHKELAHKLELLERKFEKHDQEIIAIFQAIRRLMVPPPVKKRKIIGFQPPRKS